MLVMVYEKKDEDLRPETRTKNSHSKFFDFKFSLTFAFPKNRVYKLIHLFEGQVLLKSSLE